jgi:SAM-dependent methyltransferase
MERRSEHDETVRDGYDQVAERYLAERNQWESIPHLERLLDQLKPNARILDVGCGGGVPVDRYLVDKGHRVIGVDISPKQIDLASKNVPRAEFEVRDMQDLEEGDYEVDAVVSFYAIFHTPRQSHGKTLKTLASFLPQDGLLLVTMGAGEWEGEEDFHGTPMRWSHYGPEKNRQLIESAGFEVLSDEIDDSGGERHQVLLARKGVSRLERMNPKAEVKARAEISAHDLSRYLDLFDELGITIWLDGGWGVDALLGEQTRSHADLDIVIQQGDVQKLRDALGELGFKDVETDDRTDWNFVMVDGNGKRIDFHVIMIDEQGRGIYGRPSVASSIRHLRSRAQARLGANRFAA